MGVLGAVNMRWQVCQLQSASFWSVHSERERCLVSNTNSRCARVTGEWEFITSEME